CRSHQRSCCARVPSRSRRRKPMPRLPTADDLGPMPSGRSGRIVASYDTTPIGEGMQQLGKGIANVGDALARAAAYEAHVASLFQAAVNQALLPRAAAAGAMPADGYGKVFAHQDVVADAQKLIDLHPALSAAEKQAAREALLFKIAHTYARNLSDEEQMLLDPDLPQRETVIDRLVRFGLPTPVAPRGTQMAQ